MPGRDACDACPWILEVLQSCPRFPWFQGHRLTTELVDLIFVVTSLMTYGAAIMIVIKLILRRNCYYFVFTCTSIGLVGLCILFQYLLKSPRPQQSCTQSWGMPSSFATFGMALFAWVIYSCMVGKIKSEMTITLTLFYCPFMVVSRIYLIYETVLQVVVGSIIGAVISTFLFWTFRDQMIPKKKNRVYSQQNAELVEMMTLGRNKSESFVFIFQKQRMDSEWEGVQDWRSRHNTDMTYDGPDGKALLMI